MRAAAVRNQRGMVLLVVLLIISLITVMAANLSRFGQSARQRIGDEQQSLQARWRLLGAEAAVAAELQRQLDGNGGILPGAARWLQPQAVRVNDADVSYVLRDLGACFNLNWLLSAPGKDKKESQNLRAPGDWLQQLFAAAGAGQGIGGEALQTMLQGFQFRDPSQLLAVARISPEAWQRLAPLLCAVSGKTEANTLNINGLTPAQIPLIQAAMVKRVEEEPLRQLLASRPEKGLKDLQQIPQAILSSLPAASLFRYSSADYQLSMESVTPEGRWRLVSQLHYEKRKMRVVYRQLEESAR